MQRCRVGCEQIDGEKILHNVDPGCLTDFANEGLGNAAAGGVAARVDDAGEAVAAFATDVHPAVNAVKHRTPCVELMNESGSFFDDTLDDGTVAQAAAGLERVLDVTLEAVFVGQDRSDAALCVPGVAVAEGAFADKHDAAGFGGFQRRAEAGDAGTDDQAVREDCWVVVVSIPVK